MIFRSFGTFGISYFSTYQYLIPMHAHHKTLVVTGGGSGIGRELVLALLGAGARVAAVDIHPAALEETAKLAGASVGQLSLHTLNIADKAAVDALPEAVISHHGAVDGLINNAGIIQPFVTVNDLDMDTVRRVMDVNFYGLLFMTKAFLPHLLQRPEAHIVNISSMGGFLPVPGQSVYGASKAAVKLLTEGLYCELKDTSVRVTIVFPGAIGTNIMANSGVENIAPPEAEQKMKPLPAPVAAKLIIRGMEENQFRVLVGKDARFLDILSRFNPRYAAEFITRQMKELLKK